MNTLAYLDFDLRIQPGSGPSGAYMARVVASPAGEPPARAFNFPASQAELDSFVAVSYTHLTLPTSDLV